MTPRNAAGAFLLGKLSGGLPTRKTKSVAGKDASSNVFVIGAVAPGRTIAHNEAKAHRLLSTLIEACASQRRGLAISNEEQSDV